MFGFLIEMITDRNGRNVLCTLQKRFIPYENWEERFSKEAKFHLQIVLMLNVEYFCLIGML